MSEQAQEEDSQELPYWAFECERDPPQFACSGFQLSGGNVLVRFGYVIYPMGVVLVATIQIGDGDHKVWRRFWTSRERAVDAAQALVEDSEDYLFGTLNLRPREDEDLDVDAFMHHLDMRLNNGFH